MSVWQSLHSGSTLCGSEGELVSVSISVYPRELESLLEALAQVDFPVNPQIYHAEGQGPGTCTTVEFPAYRGGLAQVQKALDAAGQGETAMRITRMLEELQSLSG